MINTSYTGGLGNHLFQYVFGRILATNLGYAFDSHLISGFPNTGTIIHGKKYEDPKQIIDNIHVVSMIHMMTDNDDNIDSWDAVTFGKVI